MAPREETESFKVVDRRRFTPDGEAVPPAPGEAELTARSQPEARPGTEAEPGAEQRRPEPQDRRASESERRLEGAAGAALPPASFEALVQMLAMSALDALGAIPGPDGEVRPPDLALARHGIDLLGVLEAKTRGNLAPDEARLLEQTLFDLRMLAVRAAGGRS